MRARRNARRATTLRPFADRAIAMPPVSVPTRSAAQARRTRASHCGCCSTAKQRAGACRAAPDVINRPTACSVILPSAGGSIRTGETSTPSKCESAIRRCARIVISELRGEPAASDLVSHRDRRKTVTASRTRRDSAGLVVRRRPRRIVVCRRRITVSSFSLPFRLLR